MLVSHFLPWIGIGRSEYHDWDQRFGKVAEARFHPFGSATAREIPDLGTQTPNSVDPNTMAIILFICPHIAGWRVSEPLVIESRNMELSTISSRVEEPENAPQLMFQMLCPACGNALLPLRGDWRCPRCQYHLCAGCEGGHEHQ